MKEVSRIDSNPGRSEWRGVEGTSPAESGSSLDGSRWLVNGGAVEAGVVGAIPVAPHREYYSKQSAQGLPSRAN